MWCTNLGSMIERKARRAVDVVVSSIAEGAVGADDDLLAASRELHGDKLFLIVLLECRPKFLNERRGRYGQSLDVLELASLDGAQFERQRQFHTCYYICQLGACQYHLNRIQPRHHHFVRDTDLSRRGSFDKGG